MFLAEDLGVSAPGNPTQALSWAVWPAVPTSSRCRATSSVEPLLGVGTTFTKVALLRSYSCERQSDAAEPFSTPQPPLGSGCWTGHSPVCHWDKEHHQAIPVVLCHKVRASDSIQRPGLFTGDMNSKRKNTVQQRRTLDL